MPAFTRTRGATSGLAAAAIACAAVLVVACAVGATGATGGATGGGEPSATSGDVAGAAVVAAAAAGDEPAAGADTLKEECASDDGAENVAEALLAQLDVKDGADGALAKEEKAAEAEEGRKAAAKKAYLAEANKPSMENVPRLAWDWSIPPRQFVERIAAGRSPVVLTGGPTARFGAVSKWNCRYLAPKVAGLRGLRRLDQPFYTYQDTARAQMDAPAGGDRGVAVAAGNNTMSDVCNGLVGNETSDGHGYYYYSERIKPGPFFRVAKDYHDKIVNLTG